MATEFDPNSIGGRNGTYSQFIDESGIATNDVAEPIYCMIIQSKFKNAPVNTMVRIAGGDTTALQNTFGNRDQAQERKGNYSMLLAELMLKTQPDRPMYFLNLRDYSDAQSTQIVSLSTSNKFDNTPVENIVYKNLFDRSKFWLIDKERFITEDSNAMLNFASIRSNDLTIYVRRAKTLPSTYDTTIGEHKTRYPRIDIAYLPDNQLIADTFVEVFIFGRDLTNSVATNNPTFAGLLDNNGAVIKSTTVDNLDELTKLAESSFITKVTGSVCPELLDITGNGYYIENLINAASKSTGLALAVNLDKLREYIDWDTDTAPMPYSVSFNAPNHVNTSGVYSMSAVDMLSYGMQAYASNAESITANSFTAYNTIYAQANTASNYTDNSVPGTWSGVYTVDHGYVRSKVVPVRNSDGTISKNTFYVFGDKLGLNKNDFKCVGLDNMSTDIKSLQFVGTHRTDVTLQSVDLVVDPATKLPYPKDNTGAWVYPATHPNAGVVVTFTSGVPDDAPSSGTPLATPTLTADELEALQVTYGKYTPVYKITTRNMSVTTVATTDTAYTLTVQSPIDITQTVDLTDLPASAPTATVYFVRLAEVVSELYSPAVVKGVKLLDTQFCDGSSQRLNDILDMLNTNTFRNGMLDVEKFPFKILVDGFETYIEQNTKKQLTKLAKDSARYIYIGSLPFHRSFDKSNNPYFKASPNDPVDPAYIVSGGNQDLPFTKVWSLPEGETLGDWAGGFFSSNLSYSDGVTLTTIPSGPIVAMNYGLNFLRSDRAPYTPVMGEATGTIVVEGINSLEHEYSISDRNVLEKAGYNLIIQNAAGDLVIYNTASSKPKSNQSALSNLENSFLAMQTAFEMDKIIKPVIGKRHTAELRDQKKLEADQYCEKLRAAGAIGSYENQCDTNNNTADLRAQGYFILDTTLYATNGIKIAVQRTIVRNETDLVA